MSDPLTMAAVGAVAGAALNRDDPMKGALMGAALGGAGGAGYGALTGAGGAAAGTAAGSAAGGAAQSLGAAELAALDALPPGLANLPLGPSGLLPVDVMPVQASGQMGVAPAFDFDAIARASMGSDLPGLASGASGSSVYNAPMRMPFGQAAGLLQQAQPRAQMQAPAPKRGNPQSVNYGGFASLLEPKLVERRRVSLI